MVVRRTGYTEVDLESSNIETSNAQARQDKVNTNIDDLAQSIRVQGLFSPILLIDLGNSEYELIAGQRRLLAYRSLHAESPEKFSKIPAFTYENRMEEWEKKAVSINENFTQEPMSEADKIAAVTACYNQFNNMTITSEKTGISYPKVRQYVKFERLPQVLKDLKSEGKITLDEAIDTADVFELDSSDTKDVPETDIKDCALECHEMSSTQRKVLKKARKDEPESKPLDLAKRVRETHETTKRVVIEITSSVHSRVEQYKSKREHKTIPHAAEELVEEGLAHNDF